VSRFGKAKKNAVWVVFHGFLAISLATGCQKKIDAGKTNIRFGEEPAAVVLFPLIGPMETKNQGVPSEKWHSTRFMLSSSLTQGKTYRFRGSFLAAQNCSAPQLMYIRLCPVRGGKFDIKESFSSENPVPSFEGEFGSEKSSFEADIRIPDAPECKGPIAIVLTAVEVGNAGMRQVVVAEMKTIISGADSLDQQFLVTHAE